MINLKIVEKIKSLLLNQKKKVESELKNVKESDPFMQEYRDEGSRNEDELTEEVVDSREHETTVAVEKDLKEREEDISDALDKIKVGEYGVCEICKKPIQEERLNINPTAKRCIECERNQSKS